MNQPENTQRGLVIPGDCAYSLKVADGLSQDLSDADANTAREYSMGIGNSWGIGKADRNNGVVLLWAPNERAYSLRVADGLSQDLSDADATEITRNNLLPNLRHGEYYQGLKDGSYPESVIRFQQVAVASRSSDRWPR